MSKLRDRPMNVLIMASTFPRWHDDDQPRFVLDLCKNINKDINLLVLAPHCARSKSIELIEGVKVIRFRYAPEKYETLAYGGGMLEQLRASRWKIGLLPLFLAAMFFYAFFLVIRYRCRVIHAHWIIPQGLVAALLVMLLGPKRVKLITTSHGSDMTVLNGPFINIIKRLVLKKSACITVVSHAMRQSVVAILKDLEKKTIVAPMGTDLRGLFRPINIGRVDAGPSVLFVGRLVENKGVIYLLKAMPKILKAHPQASLTIVGDGPLRSYLEGYVDDARLSGAVTFVGSVKHRDLPKYYSSADVAVFPYVEGADGTKEGFGLVVVEAQGCCCPVVASDIPALQDTMDGKQKRWLCPPANPDALANKVCELLSESDESRAKDTAIARQYVLRNFDWYDVGNQYSKIYQA